MAEKRIEDQKAWKFTKGLEVAGSLGFSIADRSTVTQASSTTTAVTINALAGTITTIAGTLAAAGEEAFTVNNTRVAATDSVIAVRQAYSGGGTPVVFVTAVAANSFQITVSNLHVSAALDAAMTINFAVIKAA